MSAFASYLVATSQPRSTTASLVFHVWERSGFRPDRADYLCRQTKLNFTSLERYHKASLSGSPPHFQTTQRWHDTHTYTYAQTTSPCAFSSRNPLPLIQRHCDAAEVKTAMRAPEDLSGKNCRSDLVLMQTAHPHTHHLYSICPGSECRLPPWVPWQH